MSYLLEEQYTSKNQASGADADSVWHRGARKVTSITIHWWGGYGQKFDTVRDFLCTNSTPTSAHYVVEAGRVSCIVSPDDCAFHAGNAEGNSHSIGIECRPEATDGDYATIAELIRVLRGIYGDIPLYPHNHWYNTACPGDYDLGRLDSLARGGISAQGTITSQEDELTPEQAAQLAYIVSPQFKADIFNGKTDTERNARKDFHNELLGTNITWYGYDGHIPAEGQRRTTNLMADLGWADTRATVLAGQVAALHELVKQLSVKQGVVIDLDAIAKAVNDNAAERMVK